MPSMTVYSRWVWALTNPGVMTAIPKSSNSS